MRDTGGVTRNAKRGRVGGLAGRVVGTVLMAGVIIGLWRVLGQGASITDPQWFANASATLSEFTVWAQHIITGLLP